LAYPVYWSSIVTLVLSRRISEILQLLYAESHFFRTPPLFQPKFRGVPLGVDPCTVMLGSAESEHPKLTNRDIVFEEFQLCDHDTSTSRTDGRTTCRSNTALCIASRFKNAQSDLPSVRRVLPPAEQLLTTETRLRATRPGVRSAISCLYRLQEQPPRPLG